MEKIESVFGRVVRKRRTKMGLSQEAFADKAGIHRTYISAIELGKVAVSIAIAQAVAVALEAPLSHIWRDVERELKGSSDL